ncbi:glycosyl transferase [Bradyrhizobium sp. Y36]|uniref:glycosyltransferase family 2 protein n=1 Tax=Bradyrhizobium sp. Y36 TaxID=2035447 RepID=UPI000BE939B3|nr:glycosyltransferase family 2 protein [Bradyrhizobium sp. Y36]PDT87313.1 glycosyl transferase [Bradyrhizobium sp. Y36]
MPSLTVVILTFNEELHLERAINSVSHIAEAIFVVDSFSTDRTVEIAKSLGCRVLSNRFESHARQFQWALENASIATDWVMKLDADEVIEQDLAHEIETRLPELSLDVTGINLNRKHIFMGRWIKHGGRFPLTMLRIFRRGQGYVEDRWMDEHVVVKGGRTITFRGGFADHNLNDLTFFTSKHNNYATREAIEVLNERLGFMPQDASLTASATSTQVAVKRLLKQKIFNRLPYELAAVGYFIFRYFLQLGILDGRSGLIYHFLQGFWYRFLVGAKVYELGRCIATLTDASQIRKELENKTGLPIATSGFNASAD